MPKGPQGQKRPADAVACAVTVAQIATGEAEEVAYVAPGRKKSGEIGGAARSHKLSSAERKAIAKTAAEARWKKEKDMSDKISDPLAGLLFGHERTLVNLKLLRGDATHVTEKELREEAHKGLLQVQLGRAQSHKDFPENPVAERVDVMELAAKL